MDRMNRAMTVGALIAAVGATATLGFQNTQPDINRQPGTQPGQPSQPGGDTLPGRTQPLRDAMQQPGMNQPGQAQIPMKGQKIARDQVDKLIVAWPADSKKAAQATLDKYGPPDGATFNALVWHDAGPWKKIMVSSEEVQHNFPMPHKDVIVGFIPMKVPADKADDLLAFDGSLILNRTAGVIGACCDSEEHNFAALNLAHDIIQGSNTPQEAREQLAKIAMAGQQGTTDPLTQDFKFDVAEGDQGDADQPASGVGTPGVNRPGMDRPGTTPGATPGLDRPGTTPPRDPNNPTNPNDPTTPPRRPGGG